MYIVFMPVRGGIKESFFDSRVYSDLHDFFELVSLDFYSDPDVFSVSDLSLSYYCFDERFSSDCFALCTKSFAGQIYDNPQILGFVYFGLKKACLKLRLQNYLN